jgi:hypothetical protein
MNRNQTTQGIIYSKLADYEHRLKLGFRYSFFVDELAKDGIIISVAYFGICLRKARELAKKTNSAQNSLQTEKTVPAQKPIIGESQKIDGFKIPNVDDISFE